MEIWKDIKDFEGYYQISNLGNVKSLDREMIVNGGIRRYYSKPICQGRKWRFLISDNLED